MSDFSRPSRPQSGGNSNWILIGLILGVIAAIGLRIVSPSILQQTAIIGQIFVGLLLAVAVPLVTSQLALALNNPRDRIRRGISHSRILVQVLIVTIVLLVLAVVTTLLFGQSDSADPFAVFLQMLNPTALVAFHSGGAGLLLFGVAMLFAAILGVMGDRAQHLVTVSNRVSRASIRTFRLLLWVAPLGLASMIGTIGGSSDTPSVATASSLPALLVTALAGLFTYTTFVLGVDWIMGQLRPKRQEGRSFDRNRRTGQRPVGGRYQSTNRTGSQSIRPTSRPTQEPRRERSPFEMGVSSTPVLDIQSPKPVQASNSVPRNSEAGPRPDTRPSPVRESQNDSERQATSDRDNDAQSGNRRYGPRDRGGRPDRREGGRDRQPGRGPRENRGDRPPRDRGPRPSRYDRRDADRSTDSAAGAESNARPPATVDAATIAEDLARVRRQLNTESHQEVENKTPEPMPAEPRRAESPAPERAASENVSLVPETPTEMHYGRSRHRKGDRPDHEPLPGVETPPMPEMVDHYSTDDMAFGRGKRKKTVK